MSYGSDIPYSSGYAGYGQMGQGGLGGQTVTRFPQVPNTFPSTPALPYSAPLPGAGSQGPFKAGLLPPNGGAESTVGGQVQSIGGALNGLQTSGGANIGGIASAIGQGIGDFGEIRNLANIDTNQLVDKSFEGQSPFDNVGGFNTKKNPFDTSAGAVLGKVGSKAATGAAIGTSILPGWGTAIGAIAGGLVGGVESIFGGSKHRAFEASQAQAMARYQALKNQQLAYRQKQQNQQAQTNYMASRLQNSYNY